MKIGFIGLGKMGIQMIDRLILNKFIDRLKGYNAHVILNLINAYDPEKVIIMVSVGLKQYSYITQKPERIKKYTLLRTGPEI